jgi:Polyketide cyclase / dehydrase and lipid transport
MARIEESTTIMRPPDRVFTYTTDAGNWSKWQTVIPQAEQTSPGAVAVGTTFRGKSRMMGLTMKWTAKATECEPSKRYGKDITCAAMIIEQHNTYVPLDRGTRFAIAYDLRVRGIFKLLSPMLVSTMRKELRRSLENLKGILEAQG